MIDFSDRTARIGALVSALWLVLVVWSLFLGGDGAERGLLQRLISLMGIVAPFALIWLAVWFEQGIRSLHDETRMLREQVAIMKPSRSEDDGPVLDNTTRRALPAAQLMPRPQTASRAQPMPAAPTDQRQASLGLDAPQPPELEPWELVAALNFPDGPDDHDAIAALRLALADPEMARLIRAAQDVVTLLAGRGIYMEELEPQDAPADLWRSFAAGARGETVAALSLGAGESALDTTSAMMRDVVFRDVAHHFMRQFDKLMSRLANEQGNEVLAALAYTRSGRAFTLLAEVTGMLGAPVETSQEDA